MLASRPSLDELKEIEATIIKAFQCEGFGWWMEFAANLASEQKPGSFTRGGFLFGVWAGIQIAAGGPMNATPLERADAIAPMQLAEDSLKLIREALAKREKEKSEG